MPSYYLYNFVLILESVRKLHGHLLTPKEESLLRTFEGMGEGAKRLYIRLFQRKGPWFRTATLSYPEINVLDATLELQRLGFCETLEGVHDRDITPDLLNTLSKYQLQAVLRAAQGTFLASLGKNAGAGMRVADIIDAITGTAHFGSTQQTLDGRSVLSKVVERELLSAAPRADAAALPTVAPSGDRPRFCAIRLSRPSSDLFKRIQRLFFLNDAQDMTLLLLVGMDKVKYPAYACPHIDIHAWKSVRRSLRPDSPHDGDEHGEEDAGHRPADQPPLPHLLMTVGCAGAKESACHGEKAGNTTMSGAPGDESFSTPPPSPSRPRSMRGEETCECYWWRRQGNESRVFPSREALDLYERALALANSLDDMGIASSTPAPASSATVYTVAASSRTTNRGLTVSRTAQRRCGPNEGHQSTQSTRHHRSLLETLCVAAFFLAHSASSPEWDPYSEIIRLEQKQQLAERSRRKRFSSAAALLDSPFPSILHQLSSAFPLLPSSSSSSSSAPALQPSPPPRPLFTSSLVPTVPVDARRVLLDDGTAAKVGGACAPPDDDRGGGVAGASAADQSFHALFGHSCVRKCASAAVWRACIAERPFLSRFTHGWVLARMLHDGVGVLEKQKKYAEAAACLRLLLSTPFCPGKRGHWWHRLSLNLEHMGRKKHSLILAETALDHDQPSLRLCDQLVLQKRVLKLAKPPLRWNKPSFLTRAAAAPLSSVCPAFSIASLKKPRSTTIYGRLVREEAKPGKKSTFVGYDGSRCTVEELALQYYAQEGGWAGTHSENGIFKTLFGLLMWDVLFADVPGVFLTPFQVAPMDLATDAFATSRRSLIEQRLQQICSQSMPKLLAEAWTHYGTQCLGVDWRYSLQHLQVVASCIGGCALANIFRLLAEDYKGWGHGLPDLLLWNEDAGTAKLVEVKGPRDQLSAYQQVWLDQLLAVGIDCEVCLVLEHKGPATSHKRKRPSNS